MPFVFLHSTLEDTLQLVIMPPWAALDPVSFLDLTADGALETHFVGRPLSKVKTKLLPVFCF